MKEDSVTRAYYQGMADYEASLAETNFRPGSGRNSPPNINTLTDLQSDYTHQLISDWDAAIAEFDQSLQSMEQAVDEFNAVHDSLQTLESSERNTQLQGYKEYLQSLLATNSQLTNAIKELLETESN